VYFPPAKRNVDTHSCHDSFLFLASQTRGSSFFRKQHLGTICLNDWPRARCPTESAIVFTNTRVVGLPANSISVRYALRLPPVPLLRNQCHQMHGTVINTDQQLSTKRACRFKRVRIFQTWACTTERILLALHFGGRRRVHLP
jgi:hypothetical protein